MDLLGITKKMGIEGFMHCAEIEKLPELAVNKDCIEIGSFKGLSAFCIAITAKSLLCVDTFKANSAGQAQERNFTTLEDFKKAVNRFNHVKWIPDKSSVAALSVPNNSADFIFIDAMHTYEDVKNDIKTWWPKLRNCGIMAFHDYGHAHFPGVKQAVDERFGKVDKHLITLAWVHKGCQMI